MAELSGKEKALVFLSSLGDDVSAKVLECLPDKISSKITNELNNFSEPSPDAVALVFKELSRFAIDHVKAQSLPHTVDQAADIEHLDSLSQLDRKSPKELLDILQDEKPQTIAFIMSYLSNNSRENFYNLLAIGRKNEIKSLEVNKVPLSNEVFEKINEQLLVM